MGLPNINIAFKSAANNTITRTARGTVGLIVRETTKIAKGAIVLTDESQIPSTLGANNQAYIKRAFLGYINRALRVIVYVLPTDATDLAEALAYFATQQIDYLCGAPACTSTEADSIATWVIARRADNMIVKAVLPEKAADNEAIINFATTGIKVEGTTFTAAEYCSRIAGILAGTPGVIAATFAPLPEVSDVARLTVPEMDVACDSGKFIIYHDGKKVKAGRAVNSLVTVTPEKNADFQKIKIVATIDTIRQDIRIVAQDTYIGKYANSYDNKCLLITAISEYFAQLEAEGILQTGSFVGIDIAAQGAYLRTKGVDVASMNEEQIKMADTDSKIFLAASIKILDAMEDINLNIIM